VISGRLVSLVAAKIHLLGDSSLGGGLLFYNHDSIPMIDGKNVNNLVISSA
jgi:hypothetical protein